MARKFYIERAGVKVGWYANLTKKLPYLGLANKYYDVYAR